MAIERRPARREHGATWAPLLARATRPSAELLTKLRDGKAAPCSGLCPQPEAGFRASYVLQVNGELVVRISQGP